MKYLELWQISGLSDISIVSTLTGLQSLFLQSLRNIKIIPDLSRLQRRRAIHLENLLGLEDVSGVFTAPALESLVHVSAQNIEPEQYRGLLKMKSLKSAIAGFGSDRNNEAFEEMVAIRGLNRGPKTFQFD